MGIIIIRYQPVAHIVLWLGIFIIFNGELFILYLDDFQNSNIKTMGKFKDSYYIGDPSQQEAMRLFKASLVGKYGGRTP